MRPNNFREAPQSRVLVLLIILPRDLRVDPCSLFSCRMMRGQEKTSTSQVGCRKGSNQESPTASILVSSMSMKELRYFCRVPDDIILEFLDGPARSIVRQVGNAIFFTLELDFATRIHRW